MIQCYARATVIILNMLFSLLPLQIILGQTSANKQVKSGIVSLSSELAPLFDISDLPAYRDQTSIGQRSSYDTTGGNDDGFSGKYSFVRRRQDSSLVILDVRGPGVINRIWTPTPSEDSLDFYIDDTTRATFTIHYKDLFSGKVFPFVAPLCNNQLGGYYCYLPIPFQQRCMVVFRGKQTQFYQIGYRLYPQQTRVKNFSIDLNKEEKAALQQVQSLWNKKERTVQDFFQGKKETFQTYNSKFQLRPGEQKTVFQVNKGGRIVGLELAPASSFEGMSKDVDIRITWDNESRPAIYCPVADFFGYAFGKASMQSLLVGTVEKKNYCYIPMPFDRGAKIEIIYRKSPGAKLSEPLTLTASVFLTNQKRNTEKEGKFYTYWNHKRTVPLNQPHELLSMSGKGHYIGTVLQTRGLEPGMTGFFEGDDSTVVDGQLTIHGTGSEDYFNGGWYAMMDRWDGPFSLPLSGSLDYTLPLSRTGGYRLFITDKIPFTKSIYHSIEHGPERNQWPATYTSVAYYYSNKPQSVGVVPGVVETMVSMPDTMVFYPQLLTFNSSGDIGIKRVWAYPTGGESMILTANGEVAIRVHLQDIPDGNYRVLLDYAQFPEGCSFSLWQRQTPLTGWMNAQAGDTVRVPHQYLCEFYRTTLSQTFTLRLNGDNEQNKFFLNRIILVKTKE
jgi:hypothetical protein